MIGIKHCHACGKDKPLEDFYRHCKKPDGRQTQCKECQNKKHKVFYSTHVAEYASTHRVYYRKNTNKIKNTQKRYYLTHKIEIAERQRLYNQTHREQQNAWKRQWRLQNKEKVAGYARKSRQDPVFYEKYRLRKVIRRVFDHQGQSKSPTTERICKCTPMKLYTYLCQTWESTYGTPYAGEECEIDHITPLKEAQTIEDTHKLFHYSNLQLLTKADNRRKEQNSTAQPTPTS